MAFDWKALVRTVAPSIAATLGGPLAGAATQAVSQALLGKPNGSEDEIAQAAAIAGPDALLKLREIDNSFKTDMAKLDIDLERINAADRADARERSKAMSDMSPLWLGVAILLVWGFINVFLLTTAKPPVVSEMVLGRILGMIDAATLAVIYYFFGSSRGSSNKDATIASISK